VFVIFLRHLFSKAFSFSTNSLVDFQLSQPYVSTGNIHELNRLSFVLLLSDFDLQTFVSCLKALDARAMRVLISDDTSPSYDILLPRCVTFYSGLLFSFMSVFTFVKSIIFVFEVYIYKFRVIEVKVNLFVIKLTKVLNEGKYHEIVKYARRYWHR
jgi:hypothetical protein